jgi:cell division protein FtsB
MKALIAILIALLLLLQYKLWFGDGNLREVWQLQAAIEAQKKENDKLRERNAALEAEVQDLKQGLEAIEERARSELGMIKKGETFYQIIEEDEIKKE